MTDDTQMFPRTSVVEPLPVSIFESHLPAEPGAAGGRPRALGRLFSLPFDGTGGFGSQ